MQKEITIGICFFVAGILCACLFGYDYFSTYGFINEYHAKNFAEADLDSVLLIGSVLWERGKFFLALWLLTYTPIRNIVPLVLRIFLFFTMGMFVGACMINIGLFGIVIAFGTWFPHGVIYLIAIVLILNRERFSFYGGRRQRLQKGIYILGTISLLITGCILEAITGTWILQRLFRMVRW